MLFEMLQFPTLNKRLVIVVLEGVIKTVFPEQVTMPLIAIILFEDYRRSPHNCSST